MQSADMDPQTAVTCRLQIWLQWVYSALKAFSLLALRLGAAGIELPCTAGILTARTLKTALLQFGCG